MTDTRESRLDAVRRQMQTARWVIAMLALAGFGGVAAAAKASHPAARSHDEGTSFTQSDDWSVDGLDWGTGSIGPSTSDESPSFGTRSS